MENDNTSRLLIGSVSSRSGVPIETIRYYERMGIMPDPDRSEGGQRLYNSGQLRRLSFIKRCRDLGFSLKEIRDLLALVEGGQHTCGEVFDLTMEHLNNVRTKLADLIKLEKALVRMSGQCSRGQVPDCPIVDILFDEM